MTPEPMKATPEWRVVRERRTTGRFRETYEVTAVRAVEGDRLIADVDEQDAPLIASAPDLLAALQMVFEYADGERPDPMANPVLVEHIRRVIAKAEGREP